MSGPRKKGRYNVDEAVALLDLSDEEFEEILPAVNNEDDDPRRDSDSDEGGGEDGLHDGMYFLKRQL